MKTVKILSAVFFLSTGLLFGVNSCVVVSRHDNGQHRGWFKNSKNPHHPRSTNPGRKKGHHPGKSKGK